MRVLSSTPFFLLCSSWANCCHCRACLKNIWYTQKSKYKATSSKIKTCICKQSSEKATENLSGILWNGCKAQLPSHYFLRIYKLRKSCYILQFWKLLLLIIYVEGYERCLRSLCFCFPILNIQSRTQYLTKYMATT